MSFHETNLTLPESIIIQLAALSEQDRNIIQRRRGRHNRLGFSYQLMFVRVFNRFPTQSPLEIQWQILTFAALQLTLKTELISAYQKRQQTISNHQIQICDYLSLSSFDKRAAEKVRSFLFTEAQRTEHASILLAKVERFLKEQQILQPARSTLERLIIAQRQKARQFIYATMLASLTEGQRAGLDELLNVDESRLSPLQKLKQPPGKPSPKALNALAGKLELIQSIGVVSLNVEWLNNNYQRSLAKYAARCSAKRLRELQPPYRYAILVCFLKQLSLDSIDHIIEMHHKLMLKVYNRANIQMDEAVRKQRKHFRKAQILLNTIVNILLNSDIEDHTTRQFFKM